MTQNDNFKYYYGQSLINEDNTVNAYESILDYIKTHGGHESGIDADLLDGHDSHDFLLLTDKDSYMAPGFYIGYSVIENKSEPALQFLYSRDIKLNGEYKYMFIKNNVDGNLRVQDLYNELLEEDGTSEIEAAKNRYVGDWEYDQQEGNLNAGLVDLELAIECLSKYGQKTKSDLNNEIDEIRQSTLSGDQFNKINYILNNYLIDCQTYDNEGNLTNTTETVLDAGAVNGLRFFLVTQEQYDQYPDPIKEDPHYVFIVKDELPEGYTTPTTISLNSFKPLFKSDGYDILVSVDGGRTYYKAGNLYQFDEDEEGLLPMYLGGETLPTILADPTKLNDNFFINGVWMREFLGTDPSTANSLESIINNQIAGLQDQVDNLNEIIDSFDNNYEVKSNKIMNNELTNSTTEYPSSFTVNSEIQSLKDQITALNEKIGNIDRILTDILGTGNGN